MSGIVSGIMARYVIIVFGSAIVFRSFFVFVCVCFASVLICLDPLKVHQVFDPMSLLSFGSSRFYICTYTYMRLFMPVTST